MRVLVVEADVAEAGRLVSGLVRQGHMVDHVASGRAALERYEQADLVLLGLELPDLDGVEVCRSIRADADTPVITLTAGDTELDRVLILQAGADDCMVKPYGFRELVARMNAVARRAISPRPAHAISRGSLRIDSRSRQVRLDDRVIEVTRKEFDLLYLLASLPDTVFSRKELMAQVWSDEWAMSSRTVDTHVSTLRNKLGDGDWIVTVRGVGYRLGTGMASSAPRCAAE
jgi:DNA-binding response OmpR family regulator